MNCQLARTNINLGGQMQWDLILDNSLDGDGLVVRDFHLTPISEYIPYNYQENEDLLNHTHLENIKSFYNKMGKKFYKNYMNPEFKTGYPIMIDDNENKPHKLYEDTYIAGAKRLEYKRYKKQFAFFCPVWIENSEDLKNINFYIQTIQKKQHIDVNGIKHVEKIVLNKQKIDFKLHQQEDYHNRFVNYLYDYLDTIKLDENLFTMKYLTNESWIKGINVKYGTIETRDTSYVLNNVLDRERPLLEFDNMLIQQFSNNNIIARQLFNFNFIFNPDELFAQTIIANSLAQEFLIEIVCEINNKQIEYKDFYTNYETIYKTIINEINNFNQEDINVNCLDYLKDNKYIDFIDKNKMTPQTCHWSLLDNANYIFQLYNGFAPVVNLDNTKENLISTSHRYFDMPDIWDEEYRVTKNNINWCNFYNSPLDVTSIRTIYTKSYFNNYIDLNTNNDILWMNSLKYDISDIKNWMKKIDGLNLTDKEIELYSKLEFGLFYTNEIYQNLITSYPEFENDYCKVFEDDKKDKSNNVWLKIFQDKQSKLFKIYFLVLDAEKLSHFNNVTFNRIRKDLINRVDIIFQNQKDNKNILKILNYILNHIIQPTIILFKKGIMPTFTNNPSTITKDSEIYYLKNDDLFHYIIRYDGKLRPTFININEDNENYFNHQYIYKTNLDKDFIQNFNKYTLTKFKPKYPSLNYFAIDKSRKLYNEDINKEDEYKYKLDYRDIYLDSFVEKDKLKTDLYTGIPKNIFEYKWFNNNKIIFLKSYLNFTILSKNLNISDKENLEKEIKKQLKIYYYNNNDDLIDYIYNLYNISYDYEYQSIDNLNNYIYTIKLNLK